MTKAVWTKFITDNAGAVVEGASVTVFLSDGITPAAIYSDPAGSAKANPFLTPSGGKAEFYADPGIYVIQASKDGKTATWNNEEIGHARRDLDLSDLGSAANARNNLGLKSAALADIVGTVSQSGGVPTGAVIERGSNVNGEYTKFADGTLICMVKTALTETDSGRYDVPYPASFSDATSNFRVAMGSEDQGLSFTRFYNVSSVTTEGTSILSAYLGVASLAYPIRYTVVGRWY